MSSTQQIKHNELFKCCMGEIRAWYLEGSIRQPCVMRMMGYYFNEFDKQCGDCKIEAKKHCDVCGGYGSEEE